jgi:hypothetical protein
MRLDVKIFKAEQYSKIGLSNLTFHWWKVFSKPKLSVLAPSRFSPEKRGSF